MRRAAVGAGGEAEVLTGLDQRRARRGLADGLGRPVRRGVVDDDQLVAVPELPGDRAKRRTHHVAVVMGDDDDRESGQFRLTQGLEGLGGVRPPLGVRDQPVA